MAPMTQGYRVRVVSPSIGSQPVFQEWLAHISDKLSALAAVEKKAGPGSFAQIIDRVDHETLLRLGILEGQVGRP